MANRKLNSIKFPDIADTYILDADKVNYDDSETYASGSVGKALQNKANTDGSYEDLTAGTANQINTSVRANDKTPYLFRTSGGSVDIGDREYVNGIVGGTIAWNQTGAYDPNSAYMASSFDASTHRYTLTLKGSVTWSREPLNYNPNGGTLKGHVFFGFIQAFGDYAEDYITAFNPALENNGSPIYLINTGTVRKSGTTAFIMQKPTIDDYRVTASATGYFSEHNSVEVMVQFFDLTQMFGSTIADYIYSLEQSTAGAGVAWFRKLFPKPYYEYNAGELKSVSGLVSHDMTGFNQWDEEWELGYYSPQGGAVSGNDNIRSKNFIPVLPNTTYHAKGSPLYVCQYDADKNFIGERINVSDANFATYPNACYIHFNMGSAYGTTYNHDICINLAWDNSRNGEYEPYELHSYPLDSDITLRGLFKLDANNSLYADGDIYPPSGEIQRRFTIVDLGTLEYSRMETGQAGAYRFGATLQNAKASDAGNVHSIVGGGLMPLVAGGAWDANADGYTIANSSIYIYLDAQKTATVASFTTAMSGVYLVYELATPTTETADPYTSPQIVNDFGTEKYVISDSVFAVPVGHDTDYPINMAAKLEMAPNSPDGDGDYIVRQTNGQNEYVPLVIEDALPATPSEDGTYNLKVTVADGVATLSWGN